LCWSGVLILSQWQKICKPREQYSLRRTTINTGSRQRPLILREDVEALLLEKAEGAQAANPKPLLLVNKKRA